MIVRNPPGTACYSLVPSLEEEQAVTGTRSLFTLERNCLVFRKKDLDLVITQKLTFMKSGGFHEIHPKPYKIRCFNKNSSVWGVQGGGYDPGFHEIQGHSPSPAFIKLNSFGWNICFYKVLGGFHVKSKDHLQGIVTLCFGLVTGSCDRTQGNNSFVRNPSVARQQGIRYLCMKVKLFVSSHLGPKVPLQCLHQKNTLLYFDTF